MKPQRLTFGRMYPNAGYQAKFRREIRRLIRAMKEDTQRELKALSFDVVNDARIPITLTQIMANLRLKRTGVSTDIVLEQINTRYPDDKYMSFVYGLWRIKELEEEYTQRRRRRFGVTGESKRKLSFFS